MIRNSTKYVSYKDLKEVTTDLKKIYSATNEEEGSSELEKFTKKWDDKYPVISDIWRRNWSGISPLFAFPEEIRKPFIRPILLKLQIAKSGKLSKTRVFFLLINPSRKSYIWHLKMLLKNGQCRLKIGLWL